MSGEINLKIHQSVLVAHGDDPLGIQRILNALIVEMGDPGMAELNLTRMEGKQLREDDLRSAVGSIPFLAERRLVIVNGPALPSGARAQERFTGWLNTVPESTLLVLVVPDVVERKEWRTLKHSHWLRRWITEYPQHALYKEFRQPTLFEMPEWIRREAARQGGQFIPAAAKTLAGYVENDTLTAVQEITKLLTYVDYRRPVEVEDVQALTAPSGSANIFDMLDSIAAGNAPQAVRMLHRLLEEQDPLSLLGMMEWQFRQLIMTREVISEKPSHQVEGELLRCGINPFRARNLPGLARRFSMPQLEQIYRRLLELDEMIKTSRITPELGLETFIASVAR